MSSLAVAGPVAPLADALDRASDWDDSLVAAHGIPIVDVPFVTIGGGLGSFAVADLLRINGVSADRIAVLGPDADPTAAYRHLAGNSQIGGGDRLRSDSGSTIDNPWGFPGYALREAWSRRSPGPLWRVATEPVLSEYFTPTAGQVYRGVAREAARIDWQSMLRSGWVRTVRRRRGGGFFTLFSPQDGSASRMAFRSLHTHLAIGYPGVRLLGDLAEFRTAHPAASHRVVSAYEPHDHVYAELKARPATVIVRGSGIVASRVLQRLIDDRESHRAETTIVHLFRSYVSGPQGSRPWFRRPGGNGFAHQAFNYPKAAWGGQLRDRLDRLEGSERAELIDEMGGTNTPDRRVWRAGLRDASRRGYYRQLVGSVAAVSPGDDGVAVAIRSQGGSQVVIEAAAVVDCTGLQAGLEEHRVLADLVAHVGAARNPKGRLDVARDFEVRGTSSGAGRLYASGAMTLGGYHAGVDSFLGLQYAAHRIVDDLAELGFCPRFDMGRSVGGWWRWVRNRRP